MQRNLRFGRGLSYQMTRIVREAKILKIDVQGAEPQLQREHETQTACGECCSVTLYYREPRLVTHSSKDGP